METFIETEDFLKNYTMQGEKLTVFHYPAPILKQVAKPVEDFDDELRLFCKNMLYTMYQSSGIGLAAPQVGVSKRIFVMDTDFSCEEVMRADGTMDQVYSNFNPKVFINPKIYDQAGEILYEEGCLSLPGIYEKVKRHESIAIEYQDMRGQPQKIEAAGLYAVCLQHENDHLNGVVFLDRLSHIKKNLLSKKFLKLKNK